jgi:hypothetical protein
MKAGGRTNMYGAVPYLMSAFGLDRNAAFAVVCEWLDQQDQTAQVQPIQSSDSPLWAGRSDVRLDKLATRAGQSDQSVLFFSAQQRLSSLAQASH